MQHQLQGRLRPQQKNLDTNARNVIILITDGLESCDNDPAKQAKKLKDKGVNVTHLLLALEWIHI